MFGLIRWFAGNSVAANLLMLFLIVAGLIALGTSKTELFPQIQPGIITVSVAYPGAAPSEVEEGICIRIEEELDGLEGIKRLTSVSGEGFGRVIVEFYDGTDVKEALNDVKTRVDSISTFPPLAEKAVVADSELIAPVLSLAVYGEVDEMTLRRLGEQLKDELAALPEITNVDLVDSKKFEVAVEVREETLQEYGLTFDQVVAAVRTGSVNLAAGSIKTEGGEILFRADHQAYLGTDFEELVVATRPDGTRTLLRDVANIRDGFEENDQVVLFNGRQATLVNVNRVGEQSVESVAGAALAFIEKRRASLPVGVSIAPWKDWSKLYVGRRDLLIDNGIIGGILVFSVLALFLNLRLAFWVTSGLLTSFLGAIWIMPVMNASINMLSLFGFIVVIGILVDDAIVVSENIYVHKKRFRKPGLKAAIDGTLEVTVPVILAVLTTIAAFLPMLTMPGVMGQFARAIPVVVVLTLAISLVESLFILPAHLKHISVADPPPRHMLDPRGWWERFQGIFGKGLERWVEWAYRPTLALAVKWRYATLALCMLFLFATAGFIGAGWIKFDFFPPIEGDNMIVTLDMPAGTPKEVTLAHINALRDAAEEVIAEVEAEHKGTLGDRRLLKYSLTTVGTQPQKMEDSWATGGATFGGGHIGEVNIELLPSEERGEEIQVMAMMARWREKVPAIPDAVELSYKADVSGGAPPIDVQLMSPNFEDLRAAADEIRAWLEDQRGVFAITDTMRPGKRELKLEITPEGESLGLTRAEIARQVRQAFYGEEAQRIQRGRDDLKIKVRYPESDRKSLAAVNEMKIRLPNGAEVPLSTVAAVELGRGPSTIERARRQRSVTVRADVDRAVGATPTDVNNELTSTFLPALIAKYDGMSFSMEGQQAQQAETMGGMMMGSMISLLLIFALLALAFKSYIQPIIVMTAIPFGAVGALVAHMVFGYSITLLSAIGLMAMAGVAVNDSLVMIDFINKTRAAGVPPLRAVLESGPRRFRAILLTSLTTFVGLVPIVFETSVQAKFLIPMALALAFGVMFCTFTTLILVPSLYMMVEDVKDGWRWLYGGKGEYDHAPGFVEDEDEAPDTGPKDEVILDEIRDLIEETKSTASSRRLSATESRRLRLEHLHTTKSGRLVQTDDPKRDGPPKG